MDIQSLINPSTFSGALIIGILASLIAGLIIGFLTGRKYEGYENNKANIKVKGNENTLNVNSDVRR